MYNQYRIVIVFVAFTGIGGKALLWFISYLSHRSQAVCVRSSTSKAISLNFSVPQGSVLGPQLFKIYTLPLRDIIKRHHLDYHIYADDTQIHALLFKLK